MNQILTVEEAFRNENYPFIKAGLDKMHSRGIYDLNFSLLMNPFVTSRQSWINLHSYVPPRPAVTKSIGVIYASGI